VTRSTQWRRILAVALPGLAGLVIGNAGPAAAASVGVRQAEARAGRPLLPARASTAGPDGAPVTSPASRPATSLRSGAFRIGRSPTSPSVARRQTPAPRLAARAGPRPRRALGVRRRSQPSGSIRAARMSIPRPGDAGGEKLPLPARALCADIALAGGAPPPPNGVWCERGGQGARVRDRHLRKAGSSGITRNPRSVGPSRISTAPRVLRINGIAFDGRQTSIRPTTAPASCSPSASMPAARPGRRPRSDSTRPMTNPDASAGTTATCTSPRTSAA
jgi:hypothetical protein